MPVAYRSIRRGERIFERMLWLAQMAAKQVSADIILLDVGPNLGAINRSALIASDYVAIPLGADLFSLQGLQKSCKKTARSNGNDKKLSKESMNDHRPDVGDGLNLRHPCRTGGNKCRGG